MRRSRVRAGVAAALAAGLAACQTAAPAPPAGHENLNATLWLQTAAEYRAVTLQAYQTALAHLDRALADPAWTAAPEQTGDYGALPAAVILDLDEAVVHSDAYQAGLVVHDREFSLEDWNDWVRSEETEPVAGALEYVRHAMNRGVQIFYVTNRTHEVEAATLATLRELGFPVDPEGEDLLTRFERPEWGTDKSSRRAFLARKHRIVQVVGDNLNDFTSGADRPTDVRMALVERYRAWWGTRWIILPNPAYGSWERALYGFDHGLPRRERLRRKLDRLVPWK